MKLMLILLFGAVGAFSQKCSPIFNKKFETIPCTGIKDGSTVAGDKDNCDEFSHCCMRGSECVVAASEPTQVDASMSKKEENDLLNDAKNTANDASSGSKDPGDDLRRLITPFLPPGMAKTCIPPVPFPGSCKPTRNEPYVLEPPINIPYCLRIPCDHLNNKMYEKSQRACGMQPGCYFDKELFEYREAFGDSVLPGVPVCHLAIRNKFFQVKARTVVRKYGSWNPYFTNCLLNEYDEEISKGPNGCELLPILDAFYVTPKLAGWKNINSQECALIDGCWRPGRGCFYPVDIHSVRIKSGQRPIVFGSKEITFGRPKCQHFDTSSPLNILKSYHRCLSAGCSVDSSVTYIYFNLLYSIGAQLTVDQHWNYWGAVEKGLVGAFNLDQMIGEYGYHSSKVVPVVKPAGPSTNNPIPFPFPPSSGGLRLPQQLPIQGFPPKKSDNQDPLSGYVPHKKVDPCGFAFKGYGARPCAPPVFRPPHSNNYCPYKPFSVPRFPTLKGRFDGCCDINLCYLPKSEISKMHSGPSHYYSEWSLFSECSASCDGGIRQRTRKCISDDRKLCTERLVDVKPCNTQRCPTWSSWGAYSPCSKTCGMGGIQSRTRHCLPRGSFCPGDAEEVKFCSQKACTDIHDSFSTFEWPIGGQ